MQDISQPPVEKGQQCSSDIKRMEIVQNRNESIIREAIISKYSDYLVGRKLCNRPFPKLIIRKGEDDFEFESTDCHATLKVTRSGKYRFIVVGKIKNKLGTISSECRVRRAFMAYKNKPNKEHRDMQMSERFNKMHREINEIKTQITTIVREFEKINLFREELNRLYELIVERNLSGNLVEYPSVTELLAGEMFHI